MRRIVLTSMLAVGLMATTYAQDKPASPSPTSPAPAAPASPQAPSQGAKADDSDKQVVVTGCIGGGPAAFTLTNAMAANSTAKPGQSAVGTTGTSTTYDLTAKAGVDLSSHVGHKVEITGTPAEASATGAIGGGASSTDKPGAGSRTPAPKLTVSAVKMVSTTCS